MPCVQLNRPATTITGKFNELSQVIRHKGQNIYRVIPQEANDIYRSNMSLSERGARLTALSMKLFTPCVIMANCASLGGLLEAKCLAEGHLTLLSLREKVEAAYQKVMDLPQDVQNFFARYNPNNQALRFLLSAARVTSVYSTYIAVNSMDITCAVLYEMGSSAVQGAERAVQRKINDISRANQTIAYLQIGAIALVALPTIYFAGRAILFSMKAVGLVSMSYSLYHAYSNQAPAEEEAPSLIQRSIQPLKNLYDSTTAFMDVYNISPGVRSALFGTGICLSTVGLGYTAVCLYGIAPSLYSLGRTVGSTYNAVSYIDTVFPSDEVAAPAEEVAELPPAAPAEEEQEAEALVEEQQEAAAAEEEAPEAAQEEQEASPPPLRRSARLRRGRK